MAAVDPSYAIALKNDALYLAAKPDNAATWAGRGLASKGVSPFAARADAVAQATAQAAFLAGPLVRDRVRVGGARVDLVGKAVVISGSSLGYAAGAQCFVIGAEEGETDTELTVLRRLS